MPSQKSHYNGIVRPKHSVLRATRRLLAFQLGEVEAKHGGTVEGKDPEQLHDFRTNLRRLRALLKIFRKKLRDISDPEVEGLARDLTGRLGKARDFDVWVAYLNSHEDTTAPAKSRAWRPFVKAQKQKRARAYRQLRDYLKGPAYGTLIAALHDLLKRLKSKKKTPAGKPIPLPRFASRKLSKIYVSIAIQTRLPAKSKAQELHAVRKLCRKGRYYAEFFSPVLGHPVQKLALRMKDLTDAFGTIHDCDVFLEHMKKAKVRPPRALKQVVIKDRDAAYEKLLTAWNRVTGGAFRKKLLANLGAHVGSFFDKKAAL